jgi:D-3-phosphoglycerate dehydrogenase / 2-oxoglutarate reductase
MHNVNSKRVFLAKPHVPVGYLDILGKRDDIRLDRLEHDASSDMAAPVLAAAHAYQTSSTRDELARHFHTGAELLQHTPNLLLVSTNGSGYDTVDVKVCTERGILVVNQAGGNAESVAEHVLGMMLMTRRRLRSRAARRHLTKSRRLHRARGVRQDRRHYRHRQCRAARRRALRRALAHGRDRL